MACRACAPSFDDTEVMLAPHEPEPRTADRSHSCRLARDCRRCWDVVKSRCRRLPRWALSLGSGGKAGVDACAGWRPRAAARARAACSIARLARFGLQTVERGQRVRCCPSISH